MIDEISADEIDFVVPAVGQSRVLAPVDTLRVHAELSASLRFKEQEREVDGVPDIVHVWRSRRCCQRIGGWWRRSVDYDLRAVENWVYSARNIKFRRKREVQIIILVRFY